MTNLLGTFHTVANQILELETIISQLTNSSANGNDDVVKQLNSYYLKVKDSSEQMLIDADQLVYQLNRFHEISRITKLMNNTLQLDAVLEELMDSIVILFGAERAYLMLYDTLTNQLTMQKAHKWHQQSVSLTEASFSYTVVQHVLENQESIFIENARSDERFTKANSIALYEQYSVACLPLILHNEIVGILYADNRDQILNFRNNDPIMTTLADQAAAIIRSVQLLQNLKLSQEQLVTSVEEERRRIRRDFHDGLGPTLSSFQMSLVVARETIDNQPSYAKEIIDELQHDTQRMIQDVRRLVDGLRPSLLDELGIVEALSTYVWELRQTTSLDIDFDADAFELPNSAAVEIALYQIAMESINNIIKHASATHFAVKLSIENNCYVLQVDDNGQGIPKIRRAGVGLNSMKDRAGELGGTFFINQLEPKGTQVLVNIPIPTGDK